MLQDAKYPKCIPRKTRQRSKIIEVRKRAERDIDYAPASANFKQPGALAEPSTLADD